MSQENLDLVLRAMRAVVARPKPDWETVNALFHPNHVLVPIEATALGGAEAKGARGYKAWLEQTADALEWEAEVKGAVDIGPHTVLVVTLNRFRGASSGAETENRVWNVVTVTNGKLTRTETYLDPAKALEAAGLSE